MGYSKRAIQKPDISKIRNSSEIHQKFKEMLTPKSAMA
jgi:hypothetical protein